MKKLKRQSDKAPCVHADSRSLKIKWEVLVTLFAALAAAMYAFARVELRLTELQSHSNSVDETRFTNADWQKERAILIAEIEKMQADIQVLCREVKANTDRLNGRNTLECPITYRAQNAPR